MRHRASIPDWLKKSVGKNKAALRQDESRATARALADKNLHTVCVEALCPNRGECYCRGEATFLILGDRCTRGCRFCAVSRAKPLPPDPGEPLRVAQTVKKWNLQFAVLTSPTRDDLPDGGAEHYARAINEIHRLSPQTGTEPLVPDFAGDAAALETVLNAGPSVLAHNVETVPSLYAAVRAGADYRRSLKLISRAKKHSPRIIAKSGLMLGLGETKTELRNVFRDLAANGCELLTLGQYLAPSKEHFPVQRYLEPAEYDELRAIALTAGLKAVLAGPLVRSSYKAGELYRRLSAG
ncbi:MAG: lipoyl synthase [Elusimicrobiaceae bacterium]|nr:lipoyl synthase [Elusimicrobiaceae bacterium]